MWESRSEPVRNGAYGESASGELALIAVQRRLLPEVRKVCPSALLVETMPAREIATIVAECHSGTIARHVLDTLAEAGVDVGTLPASLQDVVQAISLRECTPDVRDIVPAGMSERTFRRLWARHLSEPPGQVLASIRMRHACWLVEHAGMTRSAAALAAGFSSARQLRRALRRFPASTECRRVSE